MYIYLLSFIACNCDTDRSISDNCDDVGKCSCKPGFGGDKCNTCAKGFFGFPHCQSINFFQSLWHVILFSLYCLITTPIDLRMIFEKLSLENRVWWTGFLVYFELEFYCLFNLQKSSFNRLKIKLNFSNSIFQKSCADQ